MPKKGHLVVWLSDRGRIDIWLQMIWSGSLKRFVEHPSPIQLCGLCHMPKFVNWTQMPFHASFEPSEHFPDCCWPCRICLMAHKNLTDELTWKLPHYMVQYEKKNAHGGHTTMANASLKHTKAKNVSNQFLPSLLKWSNWWNWDSVMKIENRKDSCCAFIIQYFNVAHFLTTAMFF